MAGSTNINIHRINITRLCLLICWTAFISLGAEAAPPKVVSSSAASDVDDLFQRKDGWIGGDGAYSVILPSKRIVWLFSDTWVGKIRDGKRTDATMVNNTIGLQENPSESLSFFVNEGSDGKAKAAIVPADGRGWFWLQSGFTEGKKLFIFLNQVEKTDGSVFGFRSTGLWLGTVSDSEEPIKSWQVEQTKMPNTIFTSERILVWGASNLQIGDDLFIYGTDELRGKGSPKRSMILARAPIASISDFSTWRYFRDGKWIEDFHECTPLAGRLATEFSVTPFEKGYLAVYTDEGFSSKIMGRTADQPWGPWSDAVVLHSSPEMGRDKNLFCYGAKAHPALSKDHEIIISYFVNSFDFWQVARQAELYWPRFVRVKLAATE